MQNGSLQGPREENLPNPIQDPQQSPLHESAASGNDKALEVLLTGGADRNSKDTLHGNTPLHEASWRGHSRCVKLLCSLPSPVNQKLTKKDSKDTSKPVKQIVQNTTLALHGALLGTRNFGGFSSLHLAAQNGHNQCCREILLAGGDPDVQNNYGDTPLHTACRYGHAGATRILLSAKCDIKRVNLNGDTPLHIACAMGRRKLTRILLEAGCEGHVKNAQNESPRDIAQRKKLTEIIEILDTPIKEIKRDRERSSSSSRHNKRSKPTDERDGGAKKPAKAKTTKHVTIAKEANKDSSKEGSKGSGSKDKKSTKDKTKNPKDPAAVEIDPKNWSPYGCHYFPDPRSFPSPKLETLPPEPLLKGEQYFLDLAGNIKKGPVGIGNTCYCAPFFRHLEQRMSKNRKSIRKYVDRAAEKLDSKVTALAMRTDGQIEVLTRSIITERILCQDRRHHLEQWLKRGVQERATIAPHTSKSRKEQANSNTLCRSKSLEFLDEDENKFREILDSSAGGYSRSVEILDKNDIIIHRAGTYSDYRGSVNSNGKNHPDSEHGHKTVSSFYNSDKDQLSSTGKGNKSKSTTNRDSSLSEREWCSISEKEVSAHIKPIIKIPKHRKNVDRQLYSSEKSSQKHETKSKPEKYDSDRDSIASTELYENDFEKAQVAERLEQLLVKTRKILDFEKLPSTKKKPDTKKYFRALEKIRKLEADKYDYEMELSESLEKSSLSFSKHDNIAEEMEKITKSLLNSATSKEDIPISPEISKDLLQYKENHQIHSAEEGKGSSNNSNKTSSRNDLHFSDSQQQSSGRSSRNKRTQQMFTGFYTNNEFDEVVLSSSSNTLKSQTKKLVVDVADVDESAELSEMADLRELNDLKSRILNGTNWRSQVLKKTVQEINHSSGGGEILPEEPPKEPVNGSVNGVTRKYDIKSSEIKTLKLKDTASEVDGASGPIKVKDIISKFQGLQSPVSSLSDSRDKRNHQKSTSLNDGHHEEETDSESSEDDSVTEEDEEEEEPQAENLNDLEQQHVEPGFNMQSAKPQRIQIVPANYQNVPLSNVDSEVPKPPLMPKLLDTRSLIPKDAYFHELPHKFQLLRPITDNVPQTQANFPFQQVPVHGGRNRNPIPIDLNDAEITKTNAAALVAHNLSYSHHSSVPLEIPQFQQYTTDHHMQQYTPNPHQLYNNYPPHFLPPSANVNGHMPIISQPLNMVYSRPPLKVVPQKEKLLSNRKFGYTNLVDMELTRLNPSETSSAEGSTSTTFSNNHLQLLDHVQYERDKNNDSGYSTKICGSSQGASPSLSGHMDSIENPDNILLSHHHHQHHHPSTAYNGHHHHPMHLPPHPKLMPHLMQQPQLLPSKQIFGEDLYLSNVGSSSLV